MYGKHLRPCLLPLQRRLRCGLLPALPRRFAGCHGQLFRTGRCSRQRLLRSSQRRRIWYSADVVGRAHHRRHRMPGSLQTEGVPTITCAAARTRVAARALCEARGRSRRCLQLKDAVQCHARSDHHIRETRWRRQLRAGGSPHLQRQGLLVHHRPAAVPLRLQPDLARVCRRAAWAQDRFAELHP